ncbi:MAG: glycosyltransferase family 2 protein [Candidatus Scalindua sp.]
MLTYNGRCHLEYSLPSLFQTEYSKFIVSLVNNASTDNSVKFVKKSFPRVEIISNKKNLGWAGGNNVGIRHALSQDADYIALVNDDVLFDPRWINEGVKAAENSPLIGIVGFDLYDKKIHNSKEAFKIALERKIEPEVTETNNVRGVAMLVRRTVFENIGLFDESYFAYGEENDFEIRAKVAGYRMVNVSIPIWHFSEGSFGKRPLWQSYLCIRNTIRLAIKNKSFFDVIRTIYSLFNVGCNPFCRIGKEDYVNQRFRPKGVLFNFFLILICLVWNLVFIPQTFWKRYQDYFRIKRTKELLTNQKAI